MPTGMEDMASPASPKEACKGKKIQLSSRLFTISIFGKISLMMQLEQAPAVLISYKNPHYSSNYE